MFCDSLFFFFNDTATTEIYTLSLHDALPIYYHYTQAFSKTDKITPEKAHEIGKEWIEKNIKVYQIYLVTHIDKEHRSEEHTSELQSRQYLVCRLLLEKKKKQH